MNALKKLQLSVLPKTIYLSEDKAFRIVDKVEKKKAVRVFYDHDVRESGIYLEEELKDEPLFFYMKTLKSLCLQYEDIKKALLIGGGGMAFPKYFLNMSHDNTITVIEMDKRCIDIAEKYFGVTPSERLKIKCARGENYISESAMHNAAHFEDGDRISYDLIIYDAFVQSKPAKELYTEQILKLVKTLLSDRGLLAINVLNLEGGVLSMHTYLTQAVLKRIFKYVIIIPCENEGNSILLASDRELGVSYRH